MLKLHVLGFFFRGLTGENQRIIFPLDNHMKLELEKIRSSALINPNESMVNLRSQ